MREIEKTVKDSLGNERKEYEYKFSVKSNARACEESERAFDACDR